MGWNLFLALPAVINDIIVNISPSTIVYQSPTRDTDMRGYCMRGFRIKDVKLMTIGMFKDVSHSRPDQNREITGID